MTTKEELRELLAQSKSAREESLRLVRESRAEMRRAAVLVAADRAERVSRERARDGTILSRLRAGGPAGTERAICRDLRVSPKRVVRLRALLEAERRASAESAAGPAVRSVATVAPRARA